MFKNFDLLKICLFIIFIFELIVYLLYIPFLKKEKISQSIREDGPQKHLAKHGTPTMGGVIFGIFIIFCYLLVLLITKLPVFTYQNLLIIISIIGYGLIGFIDDYLIVVRHNNAGLKPNLKFILQLIVALIIYGLLIINNHDSTISFFGKTISLSFFYGVFLMFFYSATANAVNLTDGIDGLASGIIITILLGIAIYSYLISNAEILLLSLVSIVTILGFMFFNINPAKIFMGNTGSMILGGLISCIFMVLKVEFLLLIMGSALVIETLSDIIQVTYFKITHGKRIFKMAPFHHHLELLNYSEWQIDLIFWSFSLVMSLIGVILGVKLF